MVFKITLDGGLLRERVLLPAVLTLKQWETEGKIELFESDRAKSSGPQQGWPGGPPPTKPLSRFKGSRKGDSAALFQQIAAVLFPQSDPRRLNMGEVNDVAHLLRHHILGHSIFVTTNAQNFIVDGKRERLMKALKISVSTPEETVVVLEESGLLSKPSKKDVHHE